MNVQEYYTIVPLPKSSYLPQRSTINQLDGIRQASYSPSKRGISFRGETENISAGSLGLGARLSKEELAGILKNSPEKISTARKVKVADEKKASKDIQCSSSMFLAGSNLNPITNRMSSQDASLQEGEVST